MILYNPLDGDAYHKKVDYKPRTCFLMTSLGKPVPKEAVKIRRTLKKYLEEHEIVIIDANSTITGRDLLAKIWAGVLSVPLGIAIVTKDMKEKTVQNIYYEIGLLQALGKETLIINGDDVVAPSDFSRTEFIPYQRKFKDKLGKFVNTMLAQAGHYQTVAENTSKDPVLSIDYLKRAYLITGSEDDKNLLELARSKELLPRIVVSDIKNLLSC